MEDAQIVNGLVRRCVAGDAVAWEEIVQRYHRRVFNICYRFAGTSDDAQDLTQEVFIKMYRTLNSYDVERGAFMTWLTTMTRNLLVDHFRKTKQDRVTDSIDAAPSEHEDAMPLSDRIEDQACPSRRPGTEPGSQGSSPPGSAETVPGIAGSSDSKGLTGYGLRDIAAVLKVPEGTVKSRINRGRAELARLLQRIYKQVM